MIKTGEMINEEGKEDSSLPGSSVSGEEKKKPKGFKEFLKVAAAFIGSSVVSWLVDYFLLLGLNSLFSSYVEKHGAMPIWPTLDPKLPAIVIARAVSSFVNFLINRKVVFRNGSKLSILLYYVTVLVMLGLNYALLALLTYWKVPLWIAQIIAQGALYPISFLLQKKVVFRDWKNEKRA